MPNQKKNKYVITREAKETWEIKEIPENTESRSKNTWVKPSPVEPSVRPYFKKKKDE